MTSLQYPSFDNNIVPTSVATNLELLINCSTQLINEQVDDGKLVSI